MLVSNIYDIFTQLVNLLLPYYKEEMSSIDKPLDLIRLSIDEEVFVKCKGDRELRGKVLKPTHLCAHNH